VSAVIINFEGGELLCDCIASITDREVIETIVVDNGSTDGSAATAAASFPHIKLVTPDTNLGFAGGANFGAREASGELLLFLNPDIRLSPGTVSALAEEFTDCTVGVVGPPLEVASAETVLYGSTVDVLGSPVGLSRRSPPLFVSGCALMTRTKLFNELGGFDGRFFMFMEDVDYCWRVLLCGFDVKVAEMRPVWHHGGAVTPGGYMTKGTVSSTLFRISLRERNTLAMLLKCYGAALASVAGAAYVAQSVATGGLLVVSGRRRTARCVFAGLLWNVRELRRTLALRRRVQRSRAVGDTVIVRRMYRGIWKFHLLMQFGVPVVSEEEPGPVELVR
jgi:GT2 family glycosyltransferase